MACYMGCGTCCGKLRWLLFTFFIIAAAALLAAGLTKTVPGLITLFQCTTKENSLADSGACWKQFWSGYSLFFIISCIGAGCLLIALLTCCCFMCARGPKKSKDQFIAGDGGYDTGAQGDQYNYGTAPGVAKV